MSPNPALPALWRFIASAVLGGVSPKTSSSKSFKSSSLTKDLEADIVRGNILKTKKLFGNEALLYSEIDLKKPIPKVLIVDQIGILADLYNYSDIAFIGGGFSGKLHNILEAAAKGNFLLFGPNIDNYPEANLMLKEEIAEIMSTFENEDCYDIESDESAWLGSHFIHYFCDWNSCPVGNLLWTDLVFTI